MGYANLTMTAAERVAARQVPAGARKVTHKATGAVAYLYASPKGPSLRTFAAKAMKPDQSFFYRTEEQRDAAAARWFAALDARVARKAQRKADAKAVSNDLQVGDVLSASWGYDQTNVDFYQVVARTAATVSIRPIRAERVDGAQWATGTCAPMVDGFKGEAFTKRVFDGTAVRIESYAIARRLESTMVAGVRVWATRHWTAYA